MKRIKIFISSVQSEFEEERSMLCHYIRTDALLGKFFEPFIFEEVPANEFPTSHVYLKEVESCDIYLGLYGNLYGHEDTEGISPTEREYDFRVVIWRAGMAQDDPKRSKNDPRMIQSDPNTIETLVRLVKNNPSISRAELAKQLHLSERQVRKMMEQLRAEDKLIRRGGRTGEWIITEK